MIVGYPAVAERHREGAEETTALDRESGARAQGIADHAGVLKRQVGWIGEKAQCTHPFSDGWRLTGVVDYRHCYPAFRNVLGTIKSSNSSCKVV
jgi:hypothetical protein